MTHLNVLEYSTFKFVNSRGYDQAGHAGKKWCSEIDHPWERGWPRASWSKDNNDATLDALVLATIFDVKQWTRDQQGDFTANILGKNDNHVYCEVTDTEKYKLSFWGFGMVLFCDDFRGPSSL